MDVDELQPGKMRHQRVKQLGGLAVRARRHADEGAVDPVHLAVLAQIERGLPHHWVNPHHGLALRALMGQKCLRRFPRPHRRHRAPGARHHVQAHQTVRARLQGRRQGLVGRDAVGVERLSLPPGRRDHRIEKRKVGWRAAEALVGMPLHAMGELDRQAAVPGARRNGSRRWHFAERRHVREHENFGHAVVQLVARGQGLVIVLDLRAEQTADAYQKPGPVGNRPHPPQHQQAPRLVERARQQVGFRLGRGDHRGGVAGAREQRLATEACARQGPQLKAAVPIRSHLG